RPLPEQIRIDNGPEFQSAKLVAWAEINGVKLHYIQPGKPTQNAYIERFNRTFRREVLNAHLFASLSEVREIVHEWMTSYNDERPHQALGNVPPRVFSQQQARSKTEPTTAPNSTSELCRSRGSLQYQPRIRAPLSSMPSVSMASATGSSRSLPSRPSSGRGQKKVPFSKRFAWTHKPVPSQ